MRVGVVYLGVAFGLAGASAVSQTYEFVGGDWFSGEGFVERTVYSVEGVLSFDIPGHIDKKIDLDGGWVIPPYGEAHNHDLTSNWQLEDQINGYLWDGVFYAKMQSAFSVSLPEIRERLNRPDSVDVVFAFAPITGPGGHPIRLRETFFERGYYEGVFANKEEIAGIGYTQVMDRSGLERKWPALLAQRPDFIKFMLSYSEEYELRRDDAQFFGQKGLDPGLAPILVSMAHDAGLRVTAHVNTGPDFHHAVQAGVDEIAHLPGVAQPEVIRAADAAQAAEKGVVVITTLMLTTNIADDYPAWYKRVLEQHKKNLERLKTAGVTIAVGSDFPWRDTSVAEATLLHELGVFTNLELLKMWVENSPKTIFPDRKIAHLEPGYEASFLVLNGNPLVDFGQVRNIRHRFKQGRFLEVTEPKPDEE